MSTNLLKNFKRDDWLSIAQVADMRGVTRQAISKLIKKGKINHIEIGGHILVHKDELKSYQPGKPGRPKGK